jgi:hypothetical protein
MIWKKKLSTSNKAIALIKTNNAFIGDLHGKGMYVLRWDMIT